MREERDRFYYHGLPSEIELTLSVYRKTLC